MPTPLANLGQYIAGLVAPYLGDVGPNRYIDRPQTPHALDDEFDGGNPDLAARGWLFTNNARETMSRIGDVTFDPMWTGIEPGDGGNLDNDKYRSSFVDGRLLLQIGDGVDAFIYKAVPAGPSAIYAVRGDTSLYGGGGLIAAMVTRDNPTATSYASASGRHGWTGVHVDGPVKARTNIGGDVYADYTVNVSGEYPADVFCLRLTGATANKSAVGLHIDARRQKGTQQQPISGQSIAYGYAGIRVIGKYSGGGGSGFMGFTWLDYFRVLDPTLVAWFGQY